MTVSVNIKIYLLDFVPFTKKRSKKRMWPIVERVIRGESLLTSLFFFSLALDSRRGRIQNLKELNNLNIFCKFQLIKSNIEGNISHLSAKLLDGRKVNAPFSVKS